MGDLEPHRLIRAHELLAEISGSIGPATDLDTTIADVLAAMRRMMRFRGGSVCLVEDGLIRIAAADPTPSADVLAARLPVGQGLAGRVVADAVTIYSPDLDDDARVDPELRRLGTNAGITSYLAVPLMSLGEVIGLLQVDSPDVDAFDALDRFLLRGLGAQVANAIESARQFERRREVEQRQRAFLQMVSHELRTPLAIARGFTSRLAADLDSDAGVRADLLGRTEAALERMRGLVEEMILWTTLSSDDVQVTPRDIDLGELLALVARRSRSPSSIDLQVQECRARTDDRLLVLALDAVVDNALRYAGACTVSVGPHPVITISDQGPGIPAEILGRELEGYTRAPVHRDNSGLGLGLAMTSTIVGMLDGSLTVESGPEDGTTVTIALPTRLASRS